MLNARDERAIAWLIDQVGFDAVQQACERVSGNRKLYPSNVAKVLGLSIPPAITVEPPSVAREHIRDLLALLSGHMDREV